MPSLLKNIFCNPIDWEKLSSRNNFAPITIAILIFICSTGIITSHMYLVCWILILLYYKKRVNNDQTLNIMKLIIALSVINEFLGLLFNDSLVMNSAFEIIPYSLLILLTIYTAKVVDDKVLKWLVVLTIIDVCVAIFQRIIGVNSFFSSTVSEMGDVLFYDMAVNGLHVNMSGLGESVFLGLMIFEKNISCRFVNKYLFYILVCTGAFLCFNRTTMVALTCFFILKAIKERKKYLILIIGILLMAFVVSNKELMDLVFMQFFRGAESLDSGNAVSERDLVYPYYWNFAKSHFFLGNNSFKYYVDIFHDGRMFHAHNSYLQTLAIMVLLSLFYIFLLF